LGDFRQAITFCEKGLIVQQEIGDRRGEGYSLSNLGDIHLGSGDTLQAIGCYEKALAIAQEVSDKAREGRALGKLGNAYAALSDKRQAIWYLESALTSMEGSNLGNLGIVHKQFGQTEQAIVFFEQALIIYKDMNNVNGIAIGLFNIAQLYAQKNEIIHALSYAEESLQRFSQIGSPNVQHAQALVMKLQKAVNT
jgi:tetratricopeptide (TPR) repeat protein